MTVTFINAKLKYLTTGTQDLVTTLKTKGAAGRSQLTATGALFGPRSEPLRPGSSLRFRWTGRLFCTSCNGLTNKLFTGYCWTCFNTKAEADACVLNPFQCHYLKGSCRDPEWGLSFCFQPHILYLSHTGAFKVGITRLHQVPTRWFDQGATFAIPLALTGSRHQAGVLEKILSSKFSDKTVWQKMLASGNETPSDEAVAAALECVRELRESCGPLDPLNARVSAPPRAPSAGSTEWFETPPQFDLSYDGAQPITGPKTLAMERGAEIAGRFLGFKGQYLLLDSGVFNVRRHEGYEIESDLGD